MRDLTVHTKTRHRDLRLWKLGLWLASVETNENSSFQVGEREKEGRDIDIL
jgi:hypothetical protein